jgi:hypothetical protein
MCNFDPPLDNNPGPEKVEDDQAQCVEATVNFLSIFILDTNNNVLIVASTRSTWPKPHSQTI